MLTVCSVDDVILSRFAAAFERLSAIVVPETCTLTLFDTVALQLRLRVSRYPGFLRVVVVLFCGRQQFAHINMFLNGPSVAS